MKKLIFLSLISFGILLIHSCEKSKDEYPGGGLVEEASVNITNDWELQTYLRNNAEETDSMNISQYVENYSDPDIYIRSYLNSDLEEVADSGRFIFSDDFKSMHISDVSSIEDFSDEHSTLSSAVYTIVRLTGTEYWYSFENGGDAHEFRFLSK